MCGNGHDEGGAKDPRRPQHDGIDESWWDGIMRESGTPIDASRQAAPPSFTVIDPRGWHGKPVPPREWLVPRMIPAGTVTLLTGDGAAGKSTLSLQLATARTLGRQFIGLPVSNGKTLILSAEDDEAELHRRVDALRQYFDAEYDQLGDLVLVDLVGQDAVLGALDRSTHQIRATALYAAVQKLITEHRPDLLIIDALADAFAGLENDRQQARQFVGLIKRLCRDHGLTTIIIAHPSESGMASGTGKSGSTAWSNSARSRLYFETSNSRDADPDLRTLSTKKSNYGPAGGQIVVRYVGGAFVPVDGGSTLDRKAREAKVDRAFLELLRLHNELGIPVAAAPGPTYAPKRFADHQKAQGMNKTEFKAAMERHLMASRIRVEITGSPSRQRSRLVMVDEGG